MSQSQFDKAKELLKQKKVSEAIVACRNYLTSSPNDEEGWLFLAKACKLSGSLDSAEQAAKKVVELDDGMLEGYTELAEIQHALKNDQAAYATAKAGLKTIKPKKPKYPPLLIALGKSLVGLDSADAALIAASEASVLDPQSATAYEVVGDAYAKQNVAPMAISSYEKSLEIDSVQPQVLYKLANTFTKDRQYTEAARVYSRILALDPNNDAARLELARLLSRAQQYAKCAAILKDYFKKEKNPSKDIQSMYLNALLQSRQYKEASELAKKYIEIEPNSPLANRAIANGYLKSMQYAQSVEAFKKLATLDSLEFDDLRWLGTAYKYLKKDTLAALTWEEALKDTTQSDKLRSYYYGEVGSIWMNLKSYERAAEFFQKRLQVEPNAVGASINYALCMIQLEKFEKAISALKEAIARNDKYPGAYVNLGFCYFQMKEYDAGRKEFETAIKVIDTAEVKYRFELADSYRMIGLSIMLRKEITPEGSKKKWEDAIVVLKKSVKFKEDVAQTHLLIGQCYQNLNKKEDAIREYKRTLKLDPKNEAAIKGLQALQPE
jgi:tetratricopeptide (TPR) repeat protein